MARTLSSAQITQFKSTGVVHPIDVLTADEALDLIPAFHELDHRMQPWTGLPQLLKCNLVSCFVADLIRHPAILDAVEDLIGPDILCWGASFFAKPPASGGFVGWHQDLTYWGLEPPEDVVTAWLGLSDARIDNGCMSVIQGSHCEAPRQHRTRPESTNMLNSGQEVTLTDSDLARIEHIELQPGQASIHHSLTLHGSNPNTSDRPRIGLSINYISANVVQTLNNGMDSASPVRGNTSTSLFLREKRPERDFSDEALEQWLRFIQMPSGLGGVAEHIRLKANVNKVRRS